MPFVRQEDAELEVAPSASEAVIHDLQTSCLSLKASLKSGTRIFARDAGFLQRSPSKTSL